ncbi:hypothetical protein DAPPUDRAFT_245487 [Daphnia pulex]|uniref:Uncharacterized protein n=1 Tax=Daphnia pulex TaxID=6669 RepID=E9GNG1_DAPPU|nr:hypothetical protein DAPPUDRAFT_245487 [Daphnia pulex]|eukprot:EFX79025.1 hypothetical protein DAPPUDRAFT_245487 [Daphnia pulex]
MLFTTLIILPILVIRTMPCTPLDTIPTRHIRRSPIRVIRIRRTALSILTTTTTARRSTGTMATVSTRSISLQSTATTIHHHHHGYSGLTSAAAPVYPNSAVDAGDRASLLQNVSIGSPLTERWSDYGLCYNNLNDFDEQHRHHMETAVSYETETSADMHLNFQNNTGDVNQTGDGFFPSIFNEDDLQLMDMAMTDNVRGMDHVHHNHTYYALGSEASGTSQRPVSRDKHRASGSSLRSSVSDTASTPGAATSGSCSESEA